MTGFNHVVNQREKQSNVCAGYRGQKLGPRQGATQNGPVKSEKNCQAENYALAWRRPTVNVTQGTKGIELETMP